MTALAFAVIVSSWLYLSSSEQIRSRPLDPHMPDLYINKPHWTLFDRQGLPAKSMRAKRLEQRPNEAGLFLVEPVLQLNTSQQGTWHARAMQGHLYLDKASITLEKQVVLRRGSGNNGLVVKTARLQIADEGETLSTDMPVELQAGSWHFTSDGLYSSLDPHRLELRGRVRGQSQGKGGSPGVKRQP